MSKCNVFLTMYITMQGSSKGSLGFHCTFKSLNNQHKWPHINSLGTHDEARNLSLSQQEGGGGEGAINGNQQEAHWRLGKILYSLLKNISIGGCVIIIIPCNK